MKTTVKHVGSVREWEGPIENWEAHQEFIKHWCNGGEVESESEWNGDWCNRTPVRFELDRKYRIKQREPKPGEVWVDEDGDAIHIPFDCEKWQFIDKSGYKNHKYPITDIKYAAPSVESYYARKILERCDPAPYSDQRGYIAYNALQEAAQLEI